MKLKGGFYMYEETIHTGSIVNNEDPNYDTSTEEPGLVDIFTPEPKDSTDDITKKSRSLNDKLSKWKVSCFILAAALVGISLFSIYFIFFIN